MDVHFFIIKHPKPLKISEKEPLFAPLEKASGIPVDMIHSSMNLVYASKMILILVTKYHGW